MLTELVNPAETTSGGVRYLCGLVAVVTALVPLDRPGVGVDEQGTGLAGCGLAGVEDGHPGLGGVDRVRDQPVEGRVIVVPGGRTGREPVSSGCTPIL